MFPLYKPISKICDPGWGNFWPQGHNLNKLDRGRLDDASYQISSLVVSDKMFFSRFLYVSLCKTCDLMGGAILGPWSYFEQTW